MKYLADTLALHFLRAAVKGTLMWLQKWDVQIVWHISTATPSA
jgi:hypothetical protein